ncbi:MAG: hypothetical protein ACLFQX_00200 [Candidatus Kapaibacterium sp.]
MNSKFSKFAHKSLLSGEMQFWYIYTRIILSIARATSAIAHFQAQIISETACQTALNRSKAALEAVLLTTKCQILQIFAIKIKILPDLACF